MREISQIRLEKERQQKIKSLRYGLLSYLHWENLPWLANVFTFFLKATGLYQRGLGNLLDIRQEEVEIRLPRLPAAFDGFRLLWVSDLHIDKVDGQTERVVEVIESVSCDVAVFGGDSCFEHELAETTAPRMARVAAALAAKGPAFAVLGNHDYAPIVPVLREAGVRVLLNENMPIERNGEVIRLIGIDDCHYFGADDLTLAMENTEEDEFKLVLSHSPEIYKKAAAAGIDLCLAGHTHGGQVCLPSGRALVICADVPRALIKGHWKHGDMIGYTSRGAGASGVPVRFNCPPHVAVFTLRRG